MTAAQPCGRTDRIARAIIIASTGLKLLLLWPAAGVVPLGDERQYLAAARSIAATGIPAYPNAKWDEAHASPLYPYFLGGCRRLFGEASFEVAALTLQILLSALTVALVFRLTQGMMGGRTAVLATALAAFDPTLIAYSHYFWSETVYSFLVMLFVVLLLRGVDRPRLGALFVVGLAGGLAALTRAAFLSLIPLALAWVVWVRTGAVRARTAAALALACGLVVVIAPWSIRNTLRYDRFLLIDTNLGNVLYESFNAFQPGNHDIGLTRRLRQDMYAYRGVVPIRPRVQRDNIVERNNAEIRAAMQFARDHPDIVARHTVLKVAEFVNPTSFLIRKLRAGNYPLPAWLREALVYVTLATVMTGMAFAVVGMCARPFDAAGTLVILSIVSTVALSALTAAQSRYRMPIIPLLMPFTAYGLVRLRQLPDFRRYWRRWVVAAGLLAGLAVAWSQYLQYNFP